jgi:opacity protein-like surface antigen
MTRSVGACVLALALLVSAGSAAAQTGAGFVRGIGGAIFGTAGAGAAFGGGGGVSVLPNLAVTGDFGRFSDVLPSDVHDRLEEIARASLLKPIEGPIFINVSFPAPSSIVRGARSDIARFFNATAPSFYAAGGLRFSVPTDGRTHPFLEAQAGIAHIDVDVESGVAGIDVEEVRQAADMAGGSDLLMVLGSGMSVGLSGSAALEFGYRYQRIFTAPGINVHTAYGGLRIVFH